MINSLYQAYHSSQIYINKIWVSKHAFGTITLDSKMIYLSLIVISNVNQQVFSSSSKLIKHSFIDFFSDSKLIKWIFDLLQWYIGTITLRSWFLLSQVPSTQIITLLSAISSRNCREKFKNTSDYFLIFSITFFGNWFKFR